MISTIVTAFVSFISTNIDDILILMLLFSKADNIMKKHHIIIGQYLGVGLLTFASILVSLGISVFPYKYVGLLGFIPIFIGIREYVFYLNSKDYSKDIDSQTSKVSEKSKSFFINTSILSVCSITVANGGDNIGIYIPLFSHMDLNEICITVIIFSILLALWCFISLKLSSQPYIKNTLEKYKVILIPIVFICLGLYILFKSNSLEFIFKNIILS